LGSSHARWQVGLHARLMQASSNYARTQCLPGIPARKCVLALTAWAHTARISAPYAMGLQSTLQCEHGRSNATRPVAKGPLSPFSLAPGPGFQIQLDKFILVRAWVKRKWKRPHRMKETWFGGYGAWVVPLTAPFGFPGPGSRFPDFPTKCCFDHSTTRATPSRA
jgi:hypothetical protein